MDFRMRTLLQWILLVFFTFLVVTLGDINISDPEGEEYTLPTNKTGLDFKCTSDGVDMVWFKDDTELKHGGRITIVTVVQGPIGFSSLRIDAPGRDDQGLYACRNPNNPSDQDVVRVKVPAADRELKPVQIMGHPDKHVEVLEGNTFSIRCTADLATQTVWMHKGAAMGDGTADVSISLSKNASAMTRTSTLQKANAAPSDAGRYTCKDRSNNKNKDAVTVEVKPKPKFSVNIESPRADRMKVTVGKALSITCSADANRRLVWHKNGELVQGASSGFVISNVANQDGKAISTITKDTVTIDDAGIYDCVNDAVTEDRDSISVIVKDMSDIRTETVQVALRVGETLKLQCSLQSTAATDVTWLKDGQPVASGASYRVNGNELQIKHSKKSNAGVYECHFQRKNSSEIIGIMKHNVTTKPCPSLSAPSNGRYDKCPSAPVYGHMCSFQCDEGFTLQGSATRSCHLNEEGETTWSGEETICQDPADTRPTKSAQIPVSKSNHVLRAGTKMKLSCTWDGPGDHSATWEKDGTPITENSDTYRLGEDFLEVNVTGVQNKGVYKCLLVSETDGQTVGIMVFNATAKRCTNLKAPSDGRVVKCPPKSIYGSVCTFRCEEGFRLVGDNQRVCEVRPNGRKYYWTGKRPQCRKVVEEEEPTIEVVVAEKGTQPVEPAPDAKDEASPKPKPEVHPGPNPEEAESTSGESAAISAHAHSLICTFLGVSIAAYVRALLL